MAIPNVNSKPHLISVMLIAFFLLRFNKVNSSESVSFSFTKFDPDVVKDIIFRGDAYASSGTVHLTKTDSSGNPLTNSGGQALFAQPMQLWDSKTGRLASFYTDFSFVIKTSPRTTYADGLTFFMVPVESGQNQNGGLFTLFNTDTAMTPSSNKVFAVEFDTYPNNGWDPSTPHIGVNVNTIKSAVTLNWNTNDVVSGSVANVQITYNSNSKRLCVYLTYPSDGGTGGIYTLSHVVDLKTVLPERVKFGLSGSTGLYAETHEILSWDFGSTLDLESSGNKVENLFYDQCTNM